MNRRMSTIVLAVVSMLAVTLPATSGAAHAAELESAFTDDDWSVHEAQINGLAASGITKGCNPPANDRFCPTDSVTRGQMAAFLVRGFLLPQAPSAGFTDTVGHLFEADINRLAAARVTLGCNPPANDRFCPDSPVTRAQMASFLARALDLAPVDSGNFVDIDGSVHAGSINAIAAARVTIGCNPPANDRFCPGDRVTREQMASFLVRAIDGVDPIQSRLSLRPGSWCTRDRTQCGGTLAVPAGRSFEIREGWYQTLPYAPGEQASFTSSSTRFELTHGNTRLPLLGRTITSPTRATREWRTTIPPLSRGTHTFQGTWRWNGNRDLLVTVTINAR